MHVVHEEELHERGVLVQLGLAVHVGLQGCEDAGGHLLEQIRLPKQLLQRGLVAAEVSTGGEEQEG